MILELDFASKTIKVKGIMSVSDLMAKIKELKLQDWNIVSHVEYLNNTNYPQWWLTQPYHQGTENPFYVGDTLTNGGSWSGDITEFKTNC